MLQVEISLEKVGPVFDGERDELEVVFRCEVGAAFDVSGDHFSTTEKSTQRAKKVLFAGGGTSDNELVGSGVVVECEPGATLVEVV
jgi:hypothetical protein